MLYLLFCFQFHFCLILHISVWYHQSIHCGLFLFCWTIHHDQYTFFNLPVIIHYANASVSFSLIHEFYDNVLHSWPFGFIPWFLSNTINGTSLALLFFYSPDLFYYFLQFRSFVILHICKHLHILLSIFVIFMSLNAIAQINKEALNLKSRLIVFTNGFSSLTQMWTASIVNWSPKRV